MGGSEKQRLAYWQNEHRIQQEKRLAAEAGLERVKAEQRALGARYAAALDRAEKAEAELQALKAERENRCICEWDTTGSMIVKQCEYHRLRHHTIEADRIAAERRLEAADALADALEATNRRLREALEELEAEAIHRDGGGWVRYHTQAALHPKGTANPDPDEASKNCRILAWCEHCQEGTMLPHPSSERWVLECGRCKESHTLFFVPRDPGSVASQGRETCPTCGSDDPELCTLEGQEPHPHVISKVYPKAFYNCCPDSFHGTGRTEH